MQLLETCISAEEASKVQQMLKNKGVLTHLYDAKSHKFSRGITLWAVLENQYEDALALLSDKRHTVEFPLTVEEMAQLESKAYKAFEKATSSVITKCTNWILMLISVGGVGYVLFQVYNFT